jgi:hypothetical protein
MGLLKKIVDSQRDLRSQSQKEIDDLSNAVANAMAKTRKGEMPADFAPSVMEGSSAALRAAYASLVSELGPDEALSYKTKRFNEAVKMNYKVYYLNTYMTSQAIAQDAEQALASMMSGA